MRPVYKVLWGCTREEASKQKQNTTKNERKSCLQSSLEDTEFAFPLQWRRRKETRWIQQIFGLFVPSAIISNGKHNLFNKHERVGCVYWWALIAISDSGLGRVRSRDERISCQVSFKYREKKKEPVESCRRQQQQQSQYWLAPFQNVCIDQRWERKGEMCNRISP